MKSFTGRLKAVVSLGSLKILLGFVKQVALIPIVISTMGEVSYGIYAGVIGLMYLLTAMNLGPLNYVGNKMNLDVPKHTEKSDYVYCETLVGLSLATFLQTALSIVVLILSSYLYSGLVPVNIGIVSLLVISNWLFQIVFRLKLRQFEPRGELEVKVKYELVYELVELSLMLLLVYILDDISSLLLAYGVCRLILVLLTAIISNMHLRRDSSLSGPRAGFFAYLKSIPFIGTSIAMKAMAEGLPGLLLYVLSPKDIAVFNSLRSVFNAITTFGLTLVNALLPDVQLENGNPHIRNKIILFAIFFPLLVQLSLGGGIVLLFGQLLQKILHLSFDYEHICLVFTYSVLFIGTTTVVILVNAFNQMRAGLSISIFRTLSLFCVLGGSFYVDLSLSSFLLLMILVELSSGFVFGIIQLRRLRYITMERPVVVLSIMGLVVFNLILVTLGRIYLLMLVLITVSISVYIGVQFIKRFASYR